MGEPLRSTLPDRCEYRFVSVETRDADTVRVVFDALHPPEQCEKAVQTVEYVLLLGRSLPAGERGFAPDWYEVKVINGPTAVEITYSGGRPHSQCLVATGGGG